MAAQQRVEPQLDVGDRLRERRAAAESGDAEVQARVGERRRGGEDGTCAGEQREVGVGRGEDSFI
jgi:hypothetical protein